MKQPEKPPQPPAYLAPDTRTWWSAVVESFELEEHHVKLLTLAACAWDRHEEARALVSAEGLTLKTADGGIKTHPGIKIEADAKIQFARLLRELDLDVTPPAAAKRPPTLRSIGGQRAS